MSIHQPGKVLLHHLPLKFVSDRIAGGHGGKTTNQELPLIPFIDLLLCVVMFLLMSFSATGELLAQKPSIKLPTATNTTILEIAPVIAIDAVVVTLDGRRMADTSTLAASSKMERMEQLIQDLETLKRNWAILHPNQPFAGQVVVQADVAIDFRVIKKIMFSTAQAGYANVTFAVNSTDG